MVRLRREQLLLPALIGVLVVLAAVIGVAIWRARDGAAVTLPTTIGGSTPADPESEARSAVLAAYDGYIRATVEANRRSDPSYGGLELYAGDLLRLQTANGVSRHAADGVYYAGDLTSTATIDSINLNADPPTATISACMDAMSYRLVYRKDNSPVPGASAGRRYMAAATATKNSGGRWLITSAIAHTDKSC